MAAGRKAQARNPPKARDGAGDVRRSPFRRCAGPPPYGAIAVRSNQLLYAVGVDGGVARQQQLAHRNELITLRKRGFQQTGQVFLNLIAIVVAENNAARRELWQYRIQNGIRAALLLPVDGIDRGTSWRLP